MIGRRRRQRGQAGFTLVELLVVIAILGIVGFALTESVIVGFRTTDAVTTDLTKSVAVQTLQSFFTDDVKSARLVASEEPAPACATTPGVFLHLTWSEKGRIRKVSYSLETDSPAIPGQLELVRWSCTTGLTADKKPLGRLSFDPAGPAPVRARCGTVACPATPAAPATVTLSILAGSSAGTGTPAAPAQAVDLTVRRRTA